MKFCLIATLAASCFLVFAGCGQKGPLTLPDAPKRHRTIPPLRPQAPQTPNAPAGSGAAPASPGGTPGSPPPP